MSRRCEFCGELYGERDCSECGRGLCDLCTQHTHPTCWDCDEKGSWETDRDAKAKGQPED